jgi:hypothetical protein
MFPTPWWKGIFYGREAPNTQSTYWHVQLLFFNYFFFYLSKDQNCFLSYQIINKQTKTKLLLILSDNNQKDPYEMTKSSLRPILNF